MDIISVLQYFGFTPSNLTPLICIAGISMVYMDKQFKPIHMTLEAMKINISVICSFLSTVHPESFPGNLLQEMSPYKIKSDGYKVLKESGFESIMQDPVYRSTVFRYLDDQNVKTKFDVEKGGIFCYTIVLSEDFMNPVKMYLYNNPKMQQFFPTLAGVYIRDLYLQDHPEISK